MARTDRRRKQREQIRTLTSAFIGNCKERRQAAKDAVKEDRIKT